MPKSVIKWLQPVLVVLALTVSFNGWAEISRTDGVQDIPGTERVLADAIFVRPMTLLGTIVGTAFFVVTLPFTAATGSIKEAAETLVVNPGRSTFFRCLGCSSTGWRAFPDD